MCLFSKHFFSTEMALQTSTSTTSILFLDSDYLSNNTICVKNHVDQKNGKIARIYIEMKLWQNIDHQFYHLCQWFLTGVPWHTSFLWNNFRNAMNRKSCAVSVMAYSCSVSWHKKRLPTTDLFRSNKCHFLWFEINTQLSFCWLSAVSTTWHVSQLNQFN